MSNTNTAKPTRAGDLQPGQQLLRLGSVAFAQLHNLDARPVVVAATRPAQSGEVEILTSAGTLYVPAATPAVVVAAVAVTAQTVLVISRRHNFLTQIAKFGAPVVRRGPLVDETVTAVTAEEWASAPAIVLDGFLALPTLRDLSNRRDLAPRPGVLIVGTDPDDARIYGRAAVSPASCLFVLPYDQDPLGEVLNAAVGNCADRHDFDAILGPA